MIIGGAGDDTIHGNLSTGADGGLDADGSTHIDTAVHLGVRANYETDGARGDFGNLMDASRITVTDMTTGEGGTDEGEDTSTASV